MSEVVATPVEVTPPSPGEYGLFLKENGIDSKPLGKDSQDVEMLELEGKDLVKSCKLLKENKKTNFDLLLLITAVELKSSFQCVYLLHSLSTKKSLRIKISTGKENPVFPSVTSIWSTADWYEREAYDMMGFKFEGHPDLKRILNPDNWIGFPLRKDYIPPSDALNGPHPVSEKEMSDRTLSKPSK
jgi:NADH-quinone oxidoreductase subunit C